METTLRSGIGDWCLILAPPSGLPPEAAPLVLAVAVVLLLPAVDAAMRFFAAV